MMTYFDILVVMMTARGAEDSFAKGTLGIQIFRGTRAGSESLRRLKSMRQYLHCGERVVELNVHILNWATVSNACRSTDYPICISCEPKRA